MPTSRSPKKKSKPAAATGKKKTVAPAKRKPAVTGKKKTVAPAKKKPAVTGKKKTVAPAKKKAAATATPDLDIETAHGSQAAFQRFLPAARALLADEVLPLRFDPELAYYNLRVGVAALEPHRDTLQRELPKLDLVYLFNVLELGQALLFASRQAAAGGGAAAQSGPPLKELLREGHQLRGQLLKAADSLVAFGLIPAKLVAKIRAGTGSTDAAQDLSDLAALYSQYGAAFRESTPVTAAQAKRAAELGAILITRVSPQSARRVAVVKSEAVGDRDRLATLIVRGHRDLRRAGYWIWADDCDEHVPSLYARAKPRKKVVAEPAPQPSEGA